MSGFGRGGGRGGGRAGAPPGRGGGRGGFGGRGGRGGRGPVDEGPPAEIVGTFHAYTKFVDMSKVEHPNSCVDFS